jgi:dynactin-5
MFEQKTVTQYLMTDSGSKISRESYIHGSGNVVLGSNCIIQKDAILRGDLRRAGSGNAISIALGSFCSIGESTIIRPPYKLIKGTFSYFPARFGNHVYIGDNCIIESATIGNHVYIGDNCLIGHFCIIKDCVKIEPNTIVPPFTVISSFSVYSGSEKVLSLGKMIGELSESHQDVMDYRTKEFYRNAFTSF